MKRLYWADQGEILEGVVGHFENMRPDGNDPRGNDPQGIPIGLLAGHQAGGQSSGGQIGSGPGLVAAVDGDGLSRIILGQGRAGQN